MHRKIKSVIVVLVFAGALLISGCADDGTVHPTATMEPERVLTLAASTAFARLTVIAPLPSATQVPTQTKTPMPITNVLPTSIPTIVPVRGQINNKISAYKIPAVDADEEVGRFFIGQTVKVLARDETATWLFIIYAKSPTGNAWVSTKAVNLLIDLGTLPVVIFPDGYTSDFIMLPPVLYQISGSPAPPGTPPADWPYYGFMAEPANVRIGPSAGYLVIGILKQGEEVTFIGRTDDNDWLMIDYPSGLQGHGWVLSALVRANADFSGLPEYNMLATPLAP